MNTLLQPGCGQGLSRTSSWCSLTCFCGRDWGPECLGLADTPGHSTCLPPTGPAQHPPLPRGTDPSTAGLSSLPPILTGRGPHLHAVSPTVHGRAALVRTLVDGGQLLPAMQSTRGAATPTGCVAPTGCAAPAPHLSQRGLPFQPGLGPGFFRIFGSSDFLASLLSLFLPEILGEKEDTSQ